MEANVLKWAVKAQNRPPLDSFTAELRRRMLFAFDRWQRRAFPAPRPDQTELGRRVARRVKRDEPYTQTGVAGWLAGKIPREPESALELAEELGFEPGWLYFNKGPVPEGFKEARAAMIAQERQKVADAPKKKPTAPDTAKRKTRGRLAIDEDEVIRKRGDA